MCGFCNVWICVCVGFVMCGCVCMCGFCNVWVCVCVDFVTCGCVYVWVLVICGCFGNVWVFWYYVYLYLLCFGILCTVFCIVRSCIFILICFACTSVRTTATE